MAKCEIELKLKTEMHTTGTGPLELLAMIRHKERSLIKDTRFRCLDEEFYNFLHRFERTFNPLPRFYTKNGAQIYIPGSTLKGVLRGLLDAKGLERALARLGGRQVQEGLEELANELKLQQHDRYRLLLIDRYSHAVLAIVAEDLYALNQAPARSKVVRKVAQMLSVNEEELHYKHYLGLSEILFGTMGLKGAVEVTRLKAESPETVIRVFNAVARDGRLANPFYMELVKEGVVFTGKLTFKKTVLASEEDFEHFLQILGKDQLEIQIGKRKKLGWGRAQVTIKC